VTVRSCLISIGHSAHYAHIKSGVSACNPKKLSGNSDMRVALISSNSSMVLIETFLTPQKTQKNHSGQHFWPNLFLGRWLKGLAFQKFEK
jgi:hypothetical protein